VIPPPRQKKKAGAFLPLLTYQQTVCFYAGKEGMNAGRRMLIHIIHMNVFLIMPAPFTGIGAIINILSYYVNRYLEKIFAY